MNVDSQNVKNQRLPLDEELLSYKKCVLDFCSLNIPEANASIIFWKKYHNDFPILLQLAQIYLSIPGTSVCCESAFTISAYLARKERGRLSTENLSYTIFIED